MSDIRQLSSDDDNANENVALKDTFILFVLLRHYLNSFNLHKNGELPKNQIGRRGVQVK